MARNRQIPRLRYKLWHLMAGVAVLAGVFALVSWWVNDPVGAAAFRLRYGWKSARVEAAAGLGGMAGDARSVSALAAALGDSDLAVRRLAAQGLARAAPAAAETTVVPVLIAALGERDPSVRVHVLKALGRRGPRAGAAVPEIVGLLDSEWMQLRIGAVEALGSIGGDREQVIPALVKRLQDEYAAARHLATTRLFGYRRPEPPLDRVKLRLACVRALARFEPQAHEAARVLAHLLNDDDQTVLLAAKAVLFDMGRSRERTLALLECGAPSVQEFAIRDELDWPVVLEGLEHVDARVRVTAARVYAENVGSECVRAAPALVDALSDEEREVRSYAALAVARLVERRLVNESEIPSMRELLEDEDWTISLSAAQVAFFEDSYEAERALGRVMQWLEHNDADAQWRAVSLLHGCKIALTDEQSLQLLRTALNGNDRKVRHRAGSFIRERIDIEELLDGRLVEERTTKHEAVALLGPTYELDHRPRYEYESRYGHARLATIRYVLVESFAIRYLELHFETESGRLADWEITWPDQ